MAPLVRSSRRAIGGLPPRVLRDAGSVYEPERLRRAALWYRTVPAQAARGRVGRRPLGLRRWSAPPHRGPWAPRHFTPDHPPVRQPARYPASMGNRARIRSAVKAAASALPWLLLFVFGLSLQALQATQKDLGTVVQFWLFTLGSAAALLGSFGVGQRIGREQTNETLRVKLETAFRRTARLYDRLRAVQDDVNSR